MLDEKKVAQFLLPSGTKTFEFEDGGEKTTAEITMGVTIWDGKIKSFKLKLDNELVYHLP